MSKDTEEFKQNSEGKPWQEFSSKHKVEYLLESGHLSDCCFLVGDGGNAKKFKCHKWILIQASSVFETMFCGAFKEAHSSSPIPIVDFEPDDFRRFLEFIYNPMMSLISEVDSSSVDGTANFRTTLILKYSNYSVEALKELIYIGKKYIVPNLVNLCFGALGEKLQNASDETIVRIFEYAVTIENETLTETSAKLLDSKKSLQFKDLFYGLDPPVLGKLFTMLTKTSSALMLECITVYTEVNNLCLNDINGDGPKKIGGNSKEKQKNFTIIKNLYESVPFNDVSSKGFCKLAEEQPIAKYLSFRRKYEVLKLTRMAETDD